MGFEPVDRRDFLAGAGGLFLCTLAGQKVFPTGAPTCRSWPPASRCRRRSARPRRGAGAMRRRGPCSAATTSSSVPRVLDPGRAGEVEHRPDRPRPDDERKGRRQEDVHGLRLIAATPRASPPPMGPATIPGPAARGRDRRLDRRQLPEPAQPAGDDAPARRLLRPGDGRRLQGQVHRPRRIRAEEQDLQVRLGRPPRDRGRLALPRPRADGPAAAVRRACSGR